MPSYPGVDEYRRQVGSVRPIIPDTPLSSAGEGFRDLASGLRDVVNVETERKENDAAVSANSELMAARSFWMTEMQKRKESAESGAEGFTPTVLADFDKDAQERLKRAKTKRAKTVLEQQLSQVRLGVQNDSLQFEAGERLRHRSEQLNTSAKDAALVAKSNPYDFPEIAAAQKMAIDNSGLDAASRAELWVKSKSDIAVSAVLGMISSDPKGALKELSGESGVLAVNALTKEQRAKAVEYALEANHNAEVETLFNSYRADITNGDRALAKLRARTDLSDAQKDEIASDLQQKVVDLRHERKRKYVEDMAAVEASLAADQVTETTMDKIGALYKVGALSPDEYSSYQARAVKSYVANKVEKAEASVLDEALASGYPLSPHDPTQVKALNSKFKQAVAGEPLGSPAWQTAAMALGKTYKLLPERANDWLNQSSRSPDWKIVAQGAKFYGAMKADAPETVSQVHKDTLAMLSVVSDMIRVGGDEKLAVDTARQMLTAPDGVKEARQKAYYSSGEGSYIRSNASALNSFINDKVDTIGMSQPVSTDLLSSDFDKETWYHYSRIGDIEKARELAWSTLVPRAYEVSRVNGTNEMMAVPPERYGVTPEEVRKDIAGAVALYKPADGSTAEDIRLYPTEATMYQIGSVIDGKPIEPMYALYTKTGERLKDKDGKDVVYKLPRSIELVRRIEEARKKAQEEANKKRESAVSFRDFMKENEKLLRDNPSLQPVPY